MNLRELPPSLPPSVSHSGCHSNCPLTLIFPFPLLLAISRANSPSSLPSQKFLYPQPSVSTYSPHTSLTTNTSSSLSFSVLPPISCWSWRPMFPLLGCQRLRLSSLSLISESLSVRLLLQTHQVLTFLGIFLAISQVPDFFFLALFLFCS